MYTKKVDRITDINGAIAGTQKNFLFFFPCSSNHARIKEKNLKLPQIFRVHIDQN